MLCVGVVGILLMDKFVDLFGCWLCKGEVVGYLCIIDKLLVWVVVL